MIYPETKPYRLFGMEESDFGNIDNVESALEFQFKDRPKVFVLDEENVRALRKNLLYYPLNPSLISALNINYNGQYLGDFNSCLLIPIFNDHTVDHELGHAIIHQFNPRIRSFSVLELADFLLNKQKTIESFLGKLTDEGLASWISRFVVSESNLVKDYSLDDSITYYLRLKANDDAFKTVENSKFSGKGIMEKIDALNKIDDNGIHYSLGFSFVGNVLAEITQERSIIEGIKLIAQNPPRTFDDLRNPDEYVAAFTN